MTGTETSCGELPKRRLIRNGVTEKDVRDYLSSLGYDGRNARFRYLDLYAIKRPGWVQVFTFCVRVSGESTLPKLFHGVVRDDERKGIVFYLTEEVDEQRQRAEEWSEGLIKRNRSELTYVHWLLLGLFGLLLALAAVGAFCSRAGT